MKYAVVKIGGTQYKVSEQETLKVDRLPQGEGNEVEFPEVLLFVNEQEVKLGQPYISAMGVKALIEKHIKGEKIRVAKFKAKSRYRRVRGFRSLLTKIKILEIKATKPKAEEKVKELAKVIKRQGRSSKAPHE